MIRRTTLLCVILLLCSCATTTQSGTAINNQATRQLIASASLDNEARYLTYRETVYYLFSETVNKETPSSLLKDKCAYNDLFEKTIYPREAFRKDIATQINQKISSEEGARLVAYATSKEAHWDRTNLDKLVQYYKRKLAHTNSKAPQLGACKEDRALSKVQLNQLTFPDELINANPDIKHFKDVIEDTDALIMQKILAGILETVK